MIQHRYRVYCGPTLVNRVGDALDDAGPNVYIYGSAHVFVETFLTVDELVSLLNELFSGFTARDIQELPEHMNARLAGFNSVSIHVRDLGDGQLAVVNSGEFAGEIIFRNVSGIHSLTANRYWPSKYISDQTTRHDITYNLIDGRRIHWNVPDFTVRVIESGSITVGI